MSKNMRRQNISASLAEMQNGGETCYLCPGSPHRSVPVAGQIVR